MNNMPVAPMLEYQDSVRKDAFKVMAYIRRHLDIYHDAPTLEACAEGCQLPLERARTAVNYLRQYKRLCTCKLSPVDRHKR